QTGVRAQPPRPILPLVRLKVSETLRSVPATCDALSAGEANGSSRMNFSVPERVTSIRQCWSGLPLPRFWTGTDDPIWAIVPLIRFSNLHDFSPKFSRYQLSLS